LKKRKLFSLGFSKYRFYKTDFLFTRFLTTKIDICQSAEKRKGRKVLKDNEWYWLDRQTACIAISFLFYLNLETLEVLLKVYLFHISLVFKVVLHQEHRLTAWKWKFLSVPVGLYKFRATGTAIYIYNLPVFIKTALFVKRQCYIGKFLADRGMTASGRYKNI
jgi:hypothetical protein